MDLDTLPTILSFAKEQLGRNSERRAPLLNSMSTLGAKSISCHGCSGLCCTFQKNSMQMTSLEALDLYLFLQKSNRWSDELERSLNECISEFRLNVRPSTGGTQLMRKTYTCPFFAHKELGCTIDPKSKPYGCLGFNPTKPSEVEGKSCESNAQILEERETLFPQSEGEISQKITQILGLPWEKETIPQGLLDVHSAWQRLCTK